MLDEPLKDGCRLSSSEFSVPAESSIIIVHNTGGSLKFKQARDIMFLEKFRAMQVQLFFSGYW